MRCEACNKTFDKEEMKEYLGRNICEDCHMDALSTTGSCDPWAIFNTRACVGEDGYPHIINETQAHILNFLEKCDGAEPDLIAKTLKIDPADLKRELSVLRHMEKVRDEYKGGKRRFRIW